MTQSADDADPPFAMSRLDRAVVRVTLERIARRRGLPAESDANDRFAVFVHLTLRRGMRDPDKLFVFCLMAAERRFGDDKADQ